MTYSRQIGPFPRCRVAAVLVLLAAFIGVGCASAPGASAQTCSVSATAAAFGTYTAGALLPSDTTATISVSCQSSIPRLVTYTAALSQGSSGTYAARTLRSGASALTYQIYTSVTRLQVWGDGTGGTATVAGSVTATSVGLGQMQTGYARIPAGQNASPGAYTDTIMVVMTY